MRFIAAARDTPAAQRVTARSALGRGSIKTCGRSDDEDGRAARAKYFGGRKKKVDDGEKAARLRTRTVTEFPDRGHRRGGRSHRSHRRLVSHDTGPCTTAHPKNAEAAGLDVPGSMGHRGAMAHLRARRWLVLADSLRNCASGPGYGACNSRPGRAGAGCVTHAGWEGVEEIQLRRYRGPGGVDDALADLKAG